jgi:hypothetical protein
MKNVLVIGGSYFAGTSIQKTLDFSYTPFASGMEKTCAWYRRSRSA